jgi:hypothetical protein
MLKWKTGERNDVPYFYPMGYLTVIVVLNSLNSWWFYLILRKVRRAIFGGVSSRKSAKQHGNEVAASKSQ